MATVETHPVDIQVGRKPGRLPSVFRKSLTWLLIAAALFGGTWAWRRAHQVDPLGKMITSSVSRGDLIETVTATGSVTAETGAEVHIGSQITGRIKKLDTDVGQLVTAGQIIAELDLPDLEDQVKSAKAALMAAETHAQQAQTTLEQTISQSGSQISQASAGLTSSKKKLLAAQADADLQAHTVPTDVGKANAALASALAALDTARATLAQTRAGADLQIGVAEQQVVQARGNTLKAAADFARYKQLYTQGFVAPMDYDAAKTTADID